MKKEKAKGTSETQKIKKGEKKEESGLQRRRRASLTDP